MIEHEKQHDKDCDDSGKAICHRPKQRDLVRVVEGRVNLRLTSLYLDY